MPPTTLSDAAHRFCEDFASKESIETLLAHFSNTHPCEIVEHGLSCLAPFLDSPFRGHEGVRRYFSIIAALITYGDMQFSDYIIDTGVRKASVKGTARFTWITTRESWDETFTYVLDFDDKDQITRYQIWGDTGALYLASQGRLKQVSDSEGTSSHLQPGLTGQGSLNAPRKCTIANVSNSNRVSDTKDVYTCNTTRRHGEDS